MARKWFQLVGEDGKALTSADFVVVDIEDVATLQKAVKKEFSDSHLAGIAAADLTVFENRAKYYAKEALEEDSPIGSFGGSKNEALIVVVPDADDGDEGRSSCLFAHVPFLIDNIFWRRQSLHQTTSHFISHCCSTWSHYSDLRRRSRRRKRMSKYGRSRMGMLRNCHLLSTYSDERHSGRVENKLSSTIKGAYPTSPPIKEPEKVDEEEAQAL
jgi:hypothetical protein